MRRLLLLVLILVFCLAALPTVDTQAQNGQTVHIVQRGENLYRIALRYNVSQQAIIQANGITNPNLIFVGQRLIIPSPGQVGPTPTPVPGGGGGTYTVQPGDTLARIARRFNTTIAALIQLNGITNPNRILVGQVLRIPGTGGGPTPPPPPPPGAFELGGQALDLNANTQAVMRSAKMTYIKYQTQVGDGGAIGKLQQAKQAGFKVLFSVVGDKNQVLNPAYQDQLAAYAASLAQAGADAIEVWNEQNIDREWPTGSINPASYVQLLSKAYTAIKQANSNTLVISGAPAPTGAEGLFGLARVWNDDRYYSGMAAAGAARFADCIGVHYNEGIVSPNQTTGDPRGDNYPTRYFSTMLNRALAPFPGKPACFTELGYLSPEGYGPLPQGFEWARNTTAQLQARWLGEAVARARASGRVRLLIVFNIDFTRYDSDPQAGFAIIRPGNVCLACATIAAAMP